MKKRKFEEGGYTDSEDFKNLESAALRETAESQGFKMPTRSGPPKPTVGEMPKNALAGVGGGKESGTIERAKPKSFGQAFAAARRSGDKTFMFNGKKYTTEVKKDKPKMNERSKQPSSQDIDRLEASSYAQKFRADREKYMKDKSTDRVRGGMKKGGKVRSSCDGIAQRGKTKGKMV